MIKDINAITPEYFKYRLEQETEQYKQETEQYKQEIEKLQNQLQQKENIIKEVRELINYYGITPEQNDDTTCRSILKQFLNTLDKGE